MTRFFLPTASTRIKAYLDDKTAGPDRFNPNKMFYVTLRKRYCPW